MKGRVCLKIVIFRFRVLANYVYEEGAITAISDIVQHAEEDKENQSGNCDCSLGFSSLGRIVRDLWGDKVKNAKRGARAHRSGFNGARKAMTITPSRWN